ncbi:Retrovirus-related Pol polyprotein from transposon 17.6 [Gossypium australe]|uniref:Retrovirus-related Pol polyprotein from transposon 17.6 n=1 Tax=Gossypium australe TaxID=47621 RepID=A0A5B6VP42_9ROSI|nr:Retrovirus-related Pol polyprotein from transposon 17.6 [Gossypium australe]
MVKERLVLVPQISRKGLEVDKEKIEVIKDLPNLTTKETPFIFNHECIRAFEVIKEKLIYVPIIITSYWSKPFIIMCGASVYLVGAVLGQKWNNIFCAIHYASKTLNSTQRNYTTIEKK